MTAPTAYPWEDARVGASDASAGFAARLRGMLPRLETARLVLRAPVIEDFETYRAIMMSERAVYMDGPLSRREAWLDFVQCIANWHLRGHGLFTVTAGDSGETLGFVNLTMEHGDREPELGWFVTEEAEGAGYAFEAAEAVRDWGLRVAKLTAMVSYIDPPNARSINLATRLGGWHDPAASAEVSQEQGGAVAVYRHWPPADDEGGMGAYA
ncbi:GNAT family N-acetyltransferase [Sinisalibacter aestuarii]|uniref:N-acetyltransferase n=1 Tax=Sinisalibacter aestuarii TaxID=2949426 RepID=A0ABQ5LWH6_9RHOB|nr:GNAT family N-acetyltransferase [Sinisalibacter aestuarii]GKY89340.1 N-acetyltransferase [Sinisalibacter aestuarii]